MINNGKTKKKRGRPATGRDPLVTIRLPENLISVIDRQARVRAISRSEMMRVILDDTSLFEFPPLMPRVRTAYHEAGHAVIARVLRFHVTKASVRYTSPKRGKPSLGRVRHHTDWPIGGERHQRTWVLKGNRRKQQQTHGLIMLTLAGRIAEEAMIGFVADGSDNADIARVDKIAMETKVELNLDRIRSMTHMLVWRHAEAIHRAASHLIDNETLNQDQIDRIISNSRKRAAPALCLCCVGGLLLSDDKIQYLNGRK
jgi:hypothetical protein